MISSGVESGTWQRLKTVQPTDLSIRRRVDVKISEQGDTRRRTPSPKRSLQANAFVFVRALPAGCTKEDIRVHFRGVEEAVYIRLDEGPCPTAMLGYATSGGAVGAEAYNKTVMKIYRNKDLIASSMLKVAVIDEDAQPGSRTNAHDPSEGQLYLNAKKRDDRFTMPEGGERPSVFDRIK